MERKRPILKDAENAWDDTLHNTSRGMIEVEKDLDNAMNGEEWVFGE